MPRLSRALASLPQIFEPVQAGNEFVESFPNGPEAGGADPQRVALEIGNVARVIARGDLAGSWRLGEVIGALLAPERRGEGQREIAKSR